jgi:hypothetical protein
MCHGPSVRFLPEIDAHLNLNSTFRAYFEAKDDRDGGDPKQLGISDRNRADLDWKNGSFTWRYRNKLTLERTFSIGSYHLMPYFAAETYYEGQYNEWSTTALCAIASSP